MIDAEELNRRYGPAGVRFESGPGGLPVAVIASPHATATVALQGAHVLSFQPTDQRPILWLSAQSHFVAGKPIRGGIPICWPWFGPHPSDGGKPAHGFARTQTWTVLGADVDTDVARLRLGLADSPPTQALWPHAFELELIVTVGRALDVELIVRNPGATPFICTSALHSYFAVSNIANVSIHGLDGCAYLDKVLNYQRSEQRGALVITGETDRIYTDTIEDSVIVDAGWQRTIRVAKRGSRTTVVWNPWVDRARQLTDFGDEEYREMVCVETANAADDRITVPPGGEHRLATTLSVVAASGEFGSAFV